MSFTHYWKAIILHKNIIFTENEKTSMLVFFIERYCVFTQNTLSKYNTNRYQESPPFFPCRLQQAFFYSNWGKSTNEYAKKVEKKSMRGEKLLLDLIAKKKKKKHWTNLPSTTRKFNSLPTLTLPIYSIPFLVSYHLALNLTPK